MDDGRGGCSGYEALELNVEAAATAAASAFDFFHSRNSSRQARVDAIKASIAATSPKRKGVEAQLNEVISLQAEANLDCKLIRMFTDALSSLGLFIEGVGRVEHLTEIGYLGDNPGRA